MSSLNGYVVIMMQGALYALQSRSGALMNVSCTLALIYY